MIPIQNDSHIFPIFSPIVFLFFWEVHSYFLLFWGDSRCAAVELHKCSHGRNKNTKELAGWRRQGQWELQYILFHVSSVLVRLCRVVCLVMFKVPPEFTHKTKQADTFPLKTP